MTKQDIKKENKNDENTKDDKKNATTQSTEKITDNTEEDSKETVVAREVKELKKKNEDLENQVKRALADYQNLEKRSREERSSWITSANRELLLRLLPVLDTLQMAVKHSEDQSIKISIQQFLDVLKSEGVTQVETEGKNFDPRTMECVHTEEGDEGKVLEELRAGYLLHDTVLRPAQVVVGRSTNKPS